MIEQPVNYSADEKTLIAPFLSLTTKEMDAGYWSHDDLADLKSRVKTYYILSQKRRCCYCDRHLATDNHRAWDVEHIAARDDYPHFMFEPQNLAASCIDCNLRKSTKDPYLNKNALINKRRKKYPNRSEDFRLVHPHFDTYKVHIYRNDMVYLGKTPKGKATIYACDLLRFAEKYIDWPNVISDVRFEDEVEEVLKETGIRSEAAVDDIVALLPTA